MTIYVKSEKQIAGIRRSCQLAANTLKYIEPYVKPGITTLELNDLMDGYMRKHNAIPAPLNYGYPKGYPKSTCTSVNEVVCHGIPNGEVLKEGDIVGIDVTTILDGYYGDTAVTYPVGKIDDEAQHLLNVTKKCLEIGIKQVKPARMTGEIGYNLSRYALLQGCSVVECYGGHGLGFEFHEEPLILHICEKNDGFLMYEGMVFTVEPMINLGGPNVILDEGDGWTVRTADGKLSAQFEHTIAVTRQGFEVLTIPC